MFPPYVPTPVDRARSFAARWASADLPITPEVDLRLCVTTLEALHAQCPAGARKLPGAALLLRLRAEQLRRVTREAARTAPDSRWRQRPADGPYAAVLRSVGGEWAVRAYLQQH